MNIIEKLKLQHNLGGVLLFREGLFLRTYNEGAYILTELLGHSLKMRSQQLKKYNNQWLVTCAFPADKLSERLPKAVQTDFGGQLAGDFNMEGYVAWFERGCREESEANARAKASNESLKTYERLASKLLRHTPYSAENLINANLSLTPQQALYILTWQRGIYPIEADLGFIESLKTKLVI